MKKANARPSSDARPRSRATAPTTTANSDREHDHRGVPLVVVEAVRRSALGAGVTGEHERVVLGDAVGDDVGLQLELLEVAGPVAVEHLDDRDRAGGRDASGRCCSRRCRRRPPAPRGTRCRAAVGPRPPAGPSSARRTARARTGRRGWRGRPGRGAAASARPPAVAGGGPPGWAAARRDRDRGCGRGWMAPGQARSRGAVAVPTPRTGRQAPPVSGCSPSATSTVSKRCHRPESCRGRATAAGGRDQDDGDAARVGHLLQLHQDRHAGRVHERHRGEVQLARAAAAGARAAGRSWPATSGRRAASVSSPRTVIRAVPSSRVWSTSGSAGSGFVVSATEWCSPPSAVQNNFSVADVYDGERAR